MASAAYETTTRTIEETTVVLRLTEHEADELRVLVGESDATRVRLNILQALQEITSPVAATASDTVEYDGKTYELGARYRDVDGDVWEFRRNEGGQVEGRYSTAYPWSDDYYPGYVERTFGPLAKL
ncbi:phiSA1p31-related protein [Streptomyces sp. NRRL F-5630]|uniref:phiSA1p31-related protein n=1 Tax=Streptomyces sp. NRRL F-5630 TaxID=1463864 RepID=UPI0004C4D7AC|nr:phiSA1p31-related protein [Streptomyces sp. NRRL F-5630]